MILIQNQKYKFSVSEPSGEVNTFEASYVCSEIFHYHGCFDVFLVVKKESMAKVTVATKKILSITPCEE